MAKLRGIAAFGTAVLACVGAFGAQPALADVKAGVDAWSRGDYAVAVREWRGPADAGDADAMFNLAQAYRLGRGVPVDEARAESYYAKAAAKGHVQAADVYGLMLFQSGRREQALPYVEDAARRGDPRSQYLLGIAYFNGDFVSKDWVRGYALLTLANSAGLPQAGSALAQMDEHVPLAQRQQGATLAQQMRTEADSARGRELAAADLALGPTEIVTTPAPAPTPVRATPSPAPAPDVLAQARAARIPQPIAKVEVSPSIAAARAAVAEATRVTGTESPADAGADFARADAPVPQAAPPPAPAVVARADPTPQPVTRAAPPPATSAPRPARVAPGGPWRVQLGAFSVEGNADKLWAQVSGRPELAGATKLAIPVGRVTKLQAGGFASQGDAEAACRKLRGAGHECIVTNR